MSLRVRRGGQAVADVHLRRFASVEGRVVASDGRTPVAGARVSLGGYAGPQNDSVNAGTFYLAWEGLTETERPPRHGVASGFPNYARVCGFEREPARWQTFQPAPPATPATPVGEADFGVRDVQTNAAGRFRFSQVLPQIVSLRAVATDGRSNARLAVLWDGKQHRVTLVLNERAAVPTGKQ